MRNKYGCIIEHIAVSDFSGQLQTIGFFYQFFKTGYIIRVVFHIPIRDGIAITCQRNGFDSVHMFEIFEYEKFVFFKSYFIIEPEVISFNDIFLKAFTQIYPNALFLIKRETNSFLLPS